MVLKNIDTLKTYLNSSRNIVIVGHRNPDGDAVGSTLGLKYFLEKKGHTVTVIMPNEYPNFLKWIPENEKILRFEDSKKHSSEVLNHSDIVFLLDFNALHRVGSEMQAALESYQNDFVLIDHHQQPDEFKYMYSDTSMSSTCQMVYHFIEMCNGLDLIDKNIATCLYTGIMTDTGSFRFRSTTSTTHRVIANLIDKGAENDLIHSNTHDSNTHNRLLLLGQALKNLKVLPEYRTAYITISEAEKEAYHFEKGDTEGFVNYALSIQDIVFAVIFIEDKYHKIIKISFRSKGSFSVNKFARNHFNGGGHDNASGGKSDSSMEETIKEFIALLPMYQNELKVSYDS